MEDLKQTTCIRLELSDGGHAFLQSIWETTNFSIVVIHGAHAWSRTVSAKEVVSIATSWKIDVGEFMRSARSHLCGQHPTSTYSISAEKLSFTIDDLLEGDEGNETLNFELRLTRVSDVEAVVRDMLNHLLDSNKKLKERLEEAENQLHIQKMPPPLAEPEPSIILSLARPNANPRRHGSSSFVEPRILDFGKINRSEERDATRSVCTRGSAMRGHGQLLHDTPNLASTRLPPAPSFDLQDHGSKQTGNHKVEMEREPISFFNPPRSRAVTEGRLEVRNNDLTVRSREAYVGFDIPLSPGIMRVLSNLSAAGVMRNGNDRGLGGQNLHGRRDEGEVTTERGGDERGVKITEMRNPARQEEQSQRSLMVDVSIDLSRMADSPNGRRNFFETKVHEEEGCRRPTTSLRPENTVSEGQAILNADVAAADFTKPVKFNGGLEEDLAYQKSGMINCNTFSDKKKLQEDHNCNATNGGILEKSSSNVGEPGRSEVRGLNKLAEGQAKEVSDEEMTSKVIVDDVHLSNSNCDSGSRAKAGFSEKPRGPRSNEARSTEEIHQEQQKLSDLEPRGPVRQEFPTEPRKHPTKKVSLESLWSEDIIDTTYVKPTTRSDKKSSLLADTAEEHQGRKRTVEDREDIRGNPLRPVKQEVEYSDFVATEKRSPQNFNTNVKREVVDLEDSIEESQDGDKDKKSGAFLNPGAPPGNTIAEILRRNSMVGGRGRGRGGGGGRGRGRRTRSQGQLLSRGSPREKRQRRRLRDDSSPSGEPNVLDPDEPNGENFDVPDSDYYNFDVERTEELISPHQIWAVYDEKDGLPRLLARIDKVARKPQFEVSIRWLSRAINPTLKPESLFEIPGYPASCGVLEHGEKHILTSINMFSHRMEFTWVARSVVAVYPKKGEVWALYRSKKMFQPAPNDGAIRKPKFRVVQVVEDVERNTSPSFQPLKKVPGFRTVWGPSTEPVSVPPHYLSLFSHRVPAYQLQGHEGSMFANVKGCWDLDPAGLPLHDAQDDV